MFDKSKRTHPASLHHYRCSRSVPRCHPRERLEPQDQRRCSSTSRATVNSSHHSNHSIPTDTELGSWQQWLRVWFLRFCAYYRLRGILLTGLNTTLDQVIVQLGFLQLFQRYQIWCKSYWFSWKIRFAHRYPVDMPVITIPQEVSFQSVLLLTLSQNPPK